MTTRRMLSPAEELTVSDPWDGTPERRAELVEFSGQPLPENEDGTLTVEMSDGPDVMRLGWVLTKSDDGELGLRGGRSVDVLREIPAA